jgi:hypothetical protein
MRKAFFLGTGVIPSENHFWVKISECFKIYYIRPNGKDGELFFPKKSQKKNVFC